MSTLPRPVLIALVGVAAIAGLFLISRGHSGNSDGSTPAPTPPAPQASTPSKPAPTAATSSTPKPATQPRHKQSPSAAARPRSHPAARTLPRPVARALHAHKVIVLLFWNPRGTDDRSVEGAVRSLSRRGGKVAVFVDRSKNVSRYTPITGPANVVQTPTLVVVNRTGQAQTATGYLDPTTVDQYVIDALRGAP